MKTRKQKYMIILACVFLLASFICIPVSAAVQDSSDTFARYFISYQGQFSNTDVIYAFGTSYSDAQSALDFIDTVNFSERANQMSSHVSAAEGEYDFPYVGYTVDFGSGDDGKAGVISYVYRDIVIQPFDDYEDFANSSIKLNGGLLNTVTSNELITDVRFSVRSISGSSIGVVYGATSFFPVYVTSTYKIGDDTYYNYSIQVPNNLEFSGQFPPLTCVLCLDFVFFPGATVSNRPSMSLLLDTNNEFIVTRYVTSPFAPDSSPYYPELSNPLYSGPNMDTENKFSEYYNQFINNEFSDSASLFKGLADGNTFIAKYSVFSQKLASIFNIMLGYMPDLGAFISLSLFFGITAFILNIGIISFKSAKERSRSDAQREEHNVEKTDAYLIRHHKSYKG